eukprot:1186117-Prorocentrum_minimum.AAC.6
MKKGWVLVDVRPGNVFEQACESVHHICVARKVLVYYKQPPCRPRSDEARGGSALLEAMQDTSQAAPRLLLTTTCWWFAYLCNVCSCALRQSHAAGSKNAALFQAIDPKSPKQWVRLALYMSMDIAPVEENEDFVEDAEEVIRGAKGVIVACSEGYEPSASRALHPCTLHHVLPSLTDIHLQTGCVCLPSPCGVTVT